MDWLVPFRSWHLGVARTARDLILCDFLAWQCSLEAERDTGRERCSENLAVEAEKSLAVPRVLWPAGIELLLRHHMGRPDCDGQRHVTRRGERSIEPDDGDSDCLEPDLPGCLRTNSKTEALAAVFPDDGLNFDRVAIDGQLDTHVDQRHFHELASRRDLPNNIAVPT